MLFCWLHAEAVQCVHYMSVSDYHRLSRHHNPSTGSDYIVYEAGESAWVQ